MTPATATATAVSSAKMTLIADVRRGTSMPRWPAADFAQRQGIETRAQARQDDDRRDDDDCRDHDIPAHHSGERAQGPERHGTHFRRTAGSHDQGRQGGEEGRQGDAGQQHPGHDRAPRGRRHAVHDGGREQRGQEGDHGDQDGPGELRHDAQRHHGRRAQGRAQRGTAADAHQRRIGEGRAIQALHGDAGPGPGRTDQRRGQDAGDADGREHGLLALGVGGRIAQVQAELTQEDGDDLGRGDGDRADAHGHHDRHNECDGQECQAQARAGYCVSSGCNSRARSAMALPVRGPKPIR